MYRHSYGDTLTHICKYAYIYIYIYMCMYAYIHIIYTYKVHRCKGKFYKTKIITTKNNPG